MSKDPVVEKSRNHPKQKQFLLMLTGGLLVVIFLCFAYWFFVSRHYEETDNAYVNGNIIPVTAQVSGTVIAVNAHDTSYVKADEPLVLLDPTDRKLALKQAEENLALVVRQTQQLYIKNRGLLATIQARELTLKQAKTDLKRRQQAVSVGGVSQEELTHAQDSFSIANSLLITAQAEWNANSVLINNTALTKHPMILEAIIKLREAYLNYIRTIVVAPISGYVAKRSVQVGQMVAPGTFLMAIVPLEELWVEANFKEQQLRHIRPGQLVKLTADLYGTSVIYHGRVIGLAGGTGSAFSLLPAQNATGNWIKVVQRLPVRIALQKKELLAHPLRIGLSMEATIDTRTHDAATGEYNDDPKSQTNVFNQLDRKIDPVITRIINKNLNNTSGNDTNPLPADNRS